MIRISNISFFRFCWKNGKLHWPKCERTPTVRAHFGQSNFSTKTEKGNITYPYYVCIFQSTEKKRKKEKGQENRSFFLILKLNSKIQRILLTAKSDIFLFLFS